ncbi:uncharacterized protein BKA78DRAFT_322006 [Phyllosticta capitalensis]|uniref:uncharacterized protein n=1 Tax=Phyllosticta capitalensis TaxID=121624 RepID=UPI00312DEB63
MARKIGPPSCHGTLPRLRCQFRHQGKQSHGELAMLVPLQAIISSHGPQFATDPLPLRRRPAPLLPGCVRSLRSSALTIARLSPLHPSARPGWPSAGERDALHVQRNNLPRLTKRSTLSKPQGEKTSAAGQRQGASLPTSSLHQPNGSPPEAVTDKAVFTCDFVLLGRRGRAL